MGRWSCAIAIGVFALSGSCGYPQPAGSGSDAGNGDGDGALGIDAALGPPTLSVLAGVPGGPGYRDGTGTDARVSGCGGMIGDGSGHVYLACGTVVRELTLVTNAVTTVAGAYGDARIVDGTGSDARFAGANAIAFDTAGHLDVVDGDTVRTIVIATGMTNVLAGAVGSAGSADGTGNFARFSGPAGIVADGSGDLFVGDASNNTIRKIVITSGAVTTFAGSADMAGTTDATGSAARFESPGALAIDATNLYVADGPGFRGALRQIALATTAVTTVAGSMMTGSADGSGSAAEFGYITGLAADGAGAVYVSDGGVGGAVTAGRTIRKLVVATHAITTVVGVAGTIGTADGTGSAAAFETPNAIAMLGSAAGYVYDDGAGTVKKLTVAGSSVAVATVVGVAPSAGDVDATGSAARLELPIAGASDGTGNYFFADGNGTVIRKLSADGSVITLAGLSRTTGHVDGGGPVARFRGVLAMVSDRAGHLYVTDLNYIRQVDATTGETTTLAGSASGIEKDGTGSAAQFAGADSIALAEDGNLYVGDEFGQSVRRVTLPGAVVTTVVTGLSTPLAVVADGAGSLFVADDTIIKKVSLADFSVTPYAGSSTAGHADGKGSAAQFTLPAEMAIDAHGTLYVVDRSTIRAIAPDTTVTTAVGTFTVAAVGPGLLPATLNVPAGIATTATGGLVFCDYNENVLLGVDHLP